MGSSLFAMRRHAHVAWIERKTRVNDTTEPRARVLVVDDEEAIADLLSSVLQRAGYDVIAAADGQQAWEFFQALPFDAVISDLKMPRLDGERLTRRIKELAPQTPIVILTGHGSTADADRLLALGVARVLHKPLRELKDLVMLLGQLLGRESE
jgi:CheY-like chemotaxis protein